jgi:tripartite-type tricarboxylate transporter receptor subunit TctC
VKIASLIAGTLSALYISQAVAADYPTKPITVIVPYAAGGVTDVAARLMAKPMSEKLGQQVMVDNRAGASGSLGAGEAAAAAPDGYTVLYGSSGNLALNTITMKGLKYDPLKDFIPIRAGWESPLVLVIPKGKPFKTLKEFVDYAAAHPSEVKFGSAGIGSNGHLAGAQFQTEAKIKLSHIPYKGTAQEVIDLVAGRLEASFEYSTVVKKYVDSGELIPLMTTGSARMASFPDTPTATEAGYPGTMTTAWSGYLVPKNTPKLVVDKLSKVVEEVLALPEVIAFYQNEGSVALKDIEGDKFRDFIRDQTERYREVITKNNISFN